MFELYVVADW